jgi:hypothetical protein
VVDNRFTEQVDILPGIVDSVPGFVDIFLKVLTLTLFLKRFLDEPSDKVERTFYAIIMLFIRF